eukprot:7272159-Prymnesium_polylepis.1
MTALSLPAPSDTSILSSASAWTTVRGKPSRMKPFPHSGVLMLSLMMPITMSSDTRPPDSMTALAFLPISVPDEGAASDGRCAYTWQCRVVCGASGCPRPPDQRRSRGAMPTQDHWSVVCGRRPAYRQRRQRAGGRPWRGGTASAAP